MPWRCSSGHAVTILVSYGRSRQSDPLSAVSRRSADVSTACRSWASGRQAVGRFVRRIFRRDIHSAPRELRGPVRRAAAARCRGFRGAGRGAVAPCAATSFDAARYCAAGLGAQGRRRLRAAASARCRRRADSDAAPNVSTAATSCCRCCPMRSSARSTRHSARSTSASQHCCGALRARARPRYTCTLWRGRSPAAAAC